MLIKNYSNFLIFYYNFTIFEKHDIRTTPDAFTGPAVAGARGHAPPPTILQSKVVVLNLKEQEVSIVIPNENKRNKLNAPMTSIYHNSPSKEFYAKVTEK